MKFKLWFNGQEQVNPERVNHLVVESPDGIRTFTEVDLSLGFSIIPLRNGQPVDVGGGTYRLIIASKEIISVDGTCVIVITDRSEWICCVCTHAVPDLGSFLLPLDAE